MNIRICEIQFPFRSPTQFLSWWKNSLEKLTLLCIRYSVCTSRYPALARGKSRRCFNAMVTAVDQSVGTIMDALRKSRMDNNSIVVYSSDNGGPARFANNLPLRGLLPTIRFNKSFHLLFLQSQLSYQLACTGSKFGVFEGGIRVPAFVWSHLLPESARGTSTDALIYISDWYACFIFFSHPPNGLYGWFTAVVILPSTEVAALYYFRATVATLKYPR